MSTEIKPMTDEELARLESRVTAHDGNHGPSSPNPVLRIFLSEWLALRERLRQEVTRRELADGAAEVLGEALQMANAAARALDSDLLAGPSLVEELRKRLRLAEEERDYLAERLLATTGELTTKTEMLRLAETKERG